MPGVLHGSLCLLPLEQGLLLDLEITICPLDSPPDSFSPPVSTLGHTAGAQSWRSKPRPSLLRQQTCLPAEPSL